MNIFEGSRRIAKLIAALIVIGFAVAIFTQRQEPVSVSYLIAAFDKVPVRVDTCDPERVTNEGIATASSGRIVNIRFCSIPASAKHLSSVQSSLQEYDALKQQELAGGKIPPLPEGFKLDISVKPSFSIAEFRKHYPQYDDLSDTQLADAIHMKFYPNMARSEFDEAVVLNRARDRALHSAKVRLGLQQNFKIPEADEGYITRSAWLQVAKSTGVLLLQMVAALAGFWAFTWSVGWIVRGFMGIPRGSDRKPNI